jgi:DNA-directed RNA polymerase subunit RPC12/RpoP
MEQHVYRCASCGARFSSERPLGKCPECRGKVLIHEEGERCRRKGCAGSGSCSGCSGCGS